MRKILTVALVLAALSSGALAQSSPGLYYRQVPTPGQWNSYFAAKQDYLGAPPLLTTGGIMTGSLATTAATTGAAGLNLPPGTAPSSPVNGDLWSTTSGLYVQINGSTVGPLGTGGGGGSISLTGTAGITVTPSPITGTGTIGITNSISSGGPTGSAIVTPVITWNTQGLITAVTTATIAPPFSAVTGSAACGQLPALIGDATTSAGSCDARVVKLQGVSVDSTSPTNGYVLTYNSGTSKWTPTAPGSTSTITVGSTVVASCSTNGYVLYNNAGTLACEAGTGTGTVTSVAMTVPAFLSVAGSPITTTGTLAVTLATETANTVFAGPTTGSAAVPTFRALVGADLPNPSASTLGGMESITSASHNWITYIDTSGVPHQAQPAFTDLSGSLATGQLPGLASANFWLGNVITTATAVSMSGDATMANTGAVTVTKLQGVSVDSTSPTNGYVLTYNSGTSKWTPTAPESGTVTSIDVSGGTTGLTTSGGPVTTSGTITLAGDLIVANGGTGRTTLTTHGVLIGAGTAPITQLSAAASGTLLAGVASSDPAFTATPTLGANGGTGGSVALKGSTSGTVTLNVAAAAGTWSMTWPTTAGFSGQVLKTDGSGVTSWTAAGTGTVNSGTSGQLAYYASSTTAVSGNANATISSGALTLGVANTTIGQLLVNGSSSGTITITPAAAAGTWTFTLPTSGGSNGYVLQTNGSGTTSWVAVSSIGCSTSGTSILQGNGSGGCGNLLLGQAFALGGSTLNLTSDVQEVVCTNTFSDATVIQAAIDTMKPVHINTGTCDITSGLIAVGPNQMIYGDGRTSTILSATSSVTNVITCGSGSSGATFQDFEVTTANHSTGVGFSCENIDRLKMLRIRVTYANVALDLTGNTVANIIDLECGAYTYCIHLDGALDTNFLNQIKCYPYSVTGTDGTNYTLSATCAYIGHADDLKISDLNSEFGSCITLTSSATFGEINNVECDGGNGLTMGAGLFVVSTFWASLGSTGVQAIVQTGGKLSMSAAHIEMGAALTNPIVSITAGSIFTWSSGEVAGNNVDQKFVYCAGTSPITQIGISNVIFDVVGGALAYTNPKIDVESGCRATISGNRIDDTGHGANVFIYVAADDWHNVTGNTAPGWTESNAAITNAIFANNNPAFTH